MEALQLTKSFVSCFKIHITFTAHCKRKKITLKKLNKYLYY